MTLIISGTNRIGSLSKIVAQYYHHHISQLGHESKVISLESLPLEILSPELYSSSYKSPLINFQEETFIPAERIVFITPEYNGGIPGVLKLFIDALSSNDRRFQFFGKKAALVGISSGRGGNIRGLDHLTGILHYLQVNVFPYKLSIPNISSHISNGELVDAKTKLLFDNQMEQFLEY